MTRPFTLGVLAVAAALGPAAAHAAGETFPNKPVTLVTAFAPGSGPDAVLRLVADKLGKRWDQRVLVENRPGGGGFIAIDAARRAAADGYTLLELDSEHLAALPHLYKSRGFETLKTFEPVAALFRTPFLVAVGSESKLKTMGDIATAAKANPEKLSFGSWGVGSPGHLGGEQFEMMTGTAMQHVPYREVSQLFTSVGAGWPSPTSRRATTPSRSRTSAGRRTRSSARPRPSRASTPSSSSARASASSDLQPVRCTRP